MATLKIPVEHLEEGMVITKTDKQWLKLPFFNAPLREKRYIDVLKNYGVKYVFIKSPDDEANVEISEEKTTPELKERPIIRGIELSSNEIEDAINICKLHLDFKNAIKNIFTDVKTGKALASEKAKKIVKTYMDLYFKKPELLVSISRLKDYDEFTFMHSVNICALSIALAARVGLDATGLNNVGLSALLHDIGKIMIPSDILNKKSKLDEKETELIKKHPIYGYEILKKQPDIPSDVLLAVLQHHENIDGSGYPLGLTDKKITRLAKIVSIVNVYDILTSDTQDSPAMIPPKALKEILNKADIYFERVLVKFFVEILSIFPTGTTVLLDTGELAVVFKVNKKEIDRPKVLIVTDEKLQTVKPYLFDLHDYNVATRKPYKSIKTAVEHKQYNIDPNKVIDDYISSYRQTEE